ncbi:unnamed protein product [Heligmosomoides polygyrus]|uniref:IgGFc_binding domain-containing protein n=1 Tax=Heligmosomoides polygyrus TaxID=6339 RepID=A0A183GNJ1_HELPZ|nr:unnamed protein product [Heligmosomoides polygyrus]
MQTDYMDQYLQKAVIENKALFVNTNATVSLVASNSLSDGGGEDKFVVLPICQLGLEYHVVGDESSRVFQSYQSTNIITIVAAEDNTTVQMDYLFTTPTVLNRGQQLTLATYYSQTTIAVTSNKPVAVMSGSVCGFGYYNPSHCSYEVGSGKTVPTMFRDRPRGQKHPHVGIDVREMQSSNVILS